MNPRRARSRGRFALWLFFVALLAGACRSSDGGGSGLARVRAAGELRWGLDVQGGEPYATEDPTRPGRLVGFEVEVMEAVSRRLGVRLRPVQNDWVNLIPSLERGTFDVGANGVEMLPSRAGRVLFTRPYYAFGLRLMARADDLSVTADLASLRGRRVGALANSQAWELLRRSGAVPVPYDGVEEPYIDLVERRTDAVLLDDLIAERYGRPKPQLRMVGDVGTGYYAMITRPGDADLAAALDAAVAELIRSGELHRIYERWNVAQPRESVLAAWTPGDSERVLRGAAPPRFTAHHAALFVQGAGMTLLVSCGAMALAIPLGIFLALARLFGGTVARTFAATWVEVLRGTPVLLQLYVLYYGLADVVRLGPLTAAVLGLGLNYAAYEAEVYRAGIQAVPKGQTEAALALGMNLPQTLRRIVLPQAFRNALPSVANDFIALLKDSSLVSVITVVELTKQMTITAVDVRGWLIPGALCAALYLGMSYPLSRFARRLESQLAGGSRS